MHQHLTLIRYQLPTLCNQRIPLVLKELGHWIPELQVILHELLRREFDRRSTDPSLSAVLEELTSQHIYLLHWGLLTRVSWVIGGQCVDHLHWHLLQINLWTHLRSRSVLYSSCCHVFLYINPRFRIWVYLPKICGVELFPYMFCCWKKGTLWYDSPRCSSRFFFWWMKILWCSCYLVIFLSKSLFKCFRCGTLLLNLFLCRCSGLDCLRSKNPFSCWRLVYWSFRLNLVSLSLATELFEVLGTLSVIITLPLLSNLISIGLTVEEEWPVVWLKKSFFLKITLFVVGLNIVILKI